jgi:hypothetical protein
VNFTNAEAALRGGFFFFKVSPDVSQRAPYGDTGGAPPELSHQRGLGKHSVEKKLLRGVAPAHYLSLAYRPFRIADLSQEKVILRVAHKKKQERVA